MADPKYFIFKVELDEHGDPKVGELVPDGVVIRLQDRFSPGTLEAYAAQVIGAIEILDDIIGQLPTDSSVIPMLVAESKGLEVQRDYFKNQAERAWNMQRKLPD